METESLPYALPLLIAALISGTLAGYAWNRPVVPGARALAWLAAAVLVWTTGYALELFAPDERSKIGLAKVQYLGIVTAPVAWVLFAASFVGRPAWLTRRTVLALLAPGAVTLLLVLTNEGHHLIWVAAELERDAPVAALDIDYGSWFWVHATYCYLLMAAGSVLLLVRVFYRPMLYRRQVVALLVSAFVPWVGNGLYLARIPPFDVLDTTPFAFTLSSVILAYTLFRHRLLDVVPVARDILVAGMRDGVVVLDLRDRVVDINNSAERIFQRSAREVIGRPAVELFAISPELAALPPGAERFEATLKLDRGERCFFEVSVDPVRDGSGVLTGRLVTLHDVTERTRDEQVRAFLLAQQATMQRVAAALNSTLELDEVFHTVVQQIHAAFGYEMVSIWLRDGDALVPQASLGYDVVLPRYSVNQAVAGRVIHSGRAAFVRDASADPDFVTIRTGTCQAILAPLKTRDGAPIGLLVVEATERRLLEDVDYALLLLLADQVSVAVINARLFEDLRAAKGAAEAATRARSQFLAYMSHEIRGVTNSIVGTSELLLQTPLASDQRTLVEQAQSSSRALLELLNDTLDYAKIEAQQLTIASGPFVLHECVEAAVEQVAVAAGSRQIDVSYVIEPDVPAVIAGDRLRLRQILVNLLDNAVKFTNAGEVTLAASVRDERDGLVELQFAVRDTGIGIPPEATGQLFEPFFQVGRPTAHAAGGTGLGLAISKHLSELMGGTMWAESDGVSGSTFFFTLRAVPLLPPLELPRETAGRLAGVHVLLLAEDTRGRAALLTQLRRWGAVVRATSALPEAVTWLAAGAPFAVSLVGLPLSHAEAAALRGAREGLALPLVQLSWHGRAVHDAASDEGFQARVYRPLAYSQLRQTLEEVLAGGGRRLRLAAPVAPARASRPLRILVVDDDQLSRALAEQLLRALGHEVRLVEDGQAALRELESDHYDVVLLDSRMPGMDGPEVARRIRGGRANGRGPYLIAATGDGQPADHRRYVEAGIDDVLRKPLWLADLRAALERHEIVRSVRSNLADLLGLYMDDSAKLLEGLREAYDRHDLDAIGRAAHRLKSSSALFGTAGIVRLSEALERLAEQGDFAAMPSLLSQLRDDFAAMRQGPRL